MIFNKYKSDAEYWRQQWNDATDRASRECEMTWEAIRRADAYKKELRELRRELQEYKLREIRELGT